MKRFHARCTFVCTEGNGNGLGGIGGKASVINDTVWRDDTNGVPCTIVSIDRATGVWHECVIEVEDKHEAELLAAGLEPVEVAPTPESDEAFVKKYFPDSWLCCLSGGAYDIGYYPKGKLSSPIGPNNRFHCQELHETPEMAWAQAAKEVREVLSLPQPPPVSAPKPQQTESDEMFVKRHYPNATVRSYVSGSCDVEYGGPLCDTPNGCVGCFGFHSSPAAAWARAAEEVRTWLLKKEPSSFNNETFVKTHYPEARVREVEHKKYDIEYGVLPNKAPQGRDSCNGLYSSRGAAWIQAAEEVRQMLMDKEPKTNKTPVAKPQPNTTNPMNSESNVTPSFIQHLRSETRDFSNDAQIAAWVISTVLVILTASGIAGLVDAVMKQNIFGTVFLSVALPFVFGVTVFSLIVVYALTTKDYEPPVKEPKTMNEVVISKLDTTYKLPQYRNSFGRTIGRFIWWAIGSTLYVAAGYGAYWVQANWSSICFDIGVFLQRVAQ